MKKIYLFFFTTLTLSLSAQEWNFQYVDFGAKPDIAVDKKGSVHIAYMLEETPGFIKHAQAQDTGFQITTIDQAYYYGPLAIALDAEGKPAIAVHHHDDEDEYVYRWDGVFWEALPIPSEGHDGWDNSLAFDSQNNIHTSSIDPAQFGSGDGVEYAYYDGNVWTKESIQAGPAKYEFSTCIQVDQNDVPHLVFYDDIGDNLVYANRVSGEWANETVANKGGMFASLVLDANNLPHISYYEQVEGEAGNVHYTYFDGEAWQSMVVDQLNYVPISFTGARNLTALAKDDKGTLHLAYSDRKVLKYATLAQETWQIESLLDYTESDTLLGAQTGLGVDSAGNPHITYFELLDQSPVSGNIMYASKPVLSNTNPVVALPFTVKLLPNPASEKLRIVFDVMPKQAVSLQLFSSEGRLLKNETVQAQAAVDWDLEDLPKGFYSLQIRCGTQKWSEQLVKQ
ncbi:MAG: T9SS type A sorting domain-containing protein [Bacteroidota bacterium]